MFIMDAIPAGNWPSASIMARNDRDLSRRIAIHWHGQREAASRWDESMAGVAPHHTSTPFGSHPDIGNQFIAMQKDSALVSVMGVWEITYLATRYAKKDSKYMEMFFLAAGAYWILTIISTWFQTRLEKRMERAYER